MNDVTHDYRGRRRRRGQRTSSPVSMRVRRTTSAAVRQRQASYQTNVSVERHVGPDAVLPVGAGQVRQRHHGQHRLQQAVGPVERHAAVRRALSVTANLNYIHDVTRRGITGNDNIGISPYNVFSYTPGVRELNRQRPEGSWPINPFGPANPFADAEEIADAGGSEPLHRRRQHQLDSVEDRAPEPSAERRWRRRSGERARSALRPARPAGRTASSPAGSLARPSRTTARSTTSTTRSTSSTTTPGSRGSTPRRRRASTRDRRSLVNPVTVGYNLLAGVDAPDSRHGADQLLQPDRAARSVTVRAGAGHHPREPA